MTKLTTPVIRVNLLRAHGSPTQYLYTHHGCRCASCRGQQSAYQSAHRADPDRIKKTAAYFAAYRAAHREEIAASKAAYRAANREDDDARKAAWYEAHRDELSVRGAAYRVSHPDECAVIGRNRRARERGNRGTHTAADVLAQHARQKGRCFYCKVKLDTFHVDHVTPLSKGGSNGPENIVIACPPCNMHKHAKHVMDFCGRLL